MNFSHFQPLLLSHPFKGDHVYTCIYNTNQTQKQPRFFLGDLAGGVLSQICIEIWAEGSPWGGWRGRWTYLMSLLRDVQRVQCEDSFPGAHVQSVFVLTHQQGGVVKDAWLMKLHQAYLCGRQRGKENKSQGITAWPAHTLVSPLGVSGSLVTRVNCVTLLHHGVVLRTPDKLDESPKCERGWPMAGALRLACIPRLYP